MINPNSEISVLFLGDTDFGEHWSDVNNLLAQEGYDYPFVKFDDFLNDADLVITNLETTFSQGIFSPLAGEKEYIHRSDPQAGRTALKDHNMTIFSLANNHSMDYGPQGLQQTIATLEQHGLTVFGAGDNAKEAKIPFEIGNEDLSLAVFTGFEYRENYDEDYGFYATKISPGVNVLSSEIPETSPETFVVAFPHWGNNYKPEDFEQQQMAHALIDSGADLVLGHGAHRMQGIEQYNGKWIVYSLGNFIFNSPGRYEEMGVTPYSLMADLRTSNSAINLRLYPIFTDNLITNYQSRFVTNEEFEEVREELIIGEEGKDKWGYYINLEIFHN